MNFRGSQLLSTSLFFQHPEVAWAEGQPFVGLGLDSVGWVELLMQRDAGFNPGDGRNCLSRWWQLKDFLFSSRSLGKMNPF